MAEEAAVYEQACNPSGIPRWHMFRTADPACSSDCRVLLQGDATQVFDGNPARLNSHNLFIVCLMSTTTSSEALVIPKATPEVTQEVTPEVVKLPRYLLEGSYSLCLTVCNSIYPDM